MLQLETVKNTFLIVGLGNPEGKYFRTYHNIGFLCAERVAAEAGVVFKKKGNQLLCDFFVGDNKVNVLKPLTYMNLSGQAVVAVARKYKILPENIIVFVDDLYIDKGNIRITIGGSGGGHNGLRSITELLGTPGYIRVRVGIKPDKIPHSQSNYVLSKIDDVSRAAIDEACARAVQAAALLVGGEKLSIVQARFNTTNAAE